MADFIGGRLEDIEGAATRLADTGVNVGKCGEHCKTASDEVKGAIDEAMGTLMTRFNDIAGEINTEIQAADTKLNTADWKGQSQVNAIAIKNELQTQINTVVEQATGTISTEKAAFEARTAEIATEVGLKFQNIMNDVNLRYSDLSKASNQTMLNLLEADKTISMG